MGSLRLQQQAFCLDCLPGPLPTRCDINLWFCETSNFGSQCVWLFCLILRIFILLHHLVQLQCEVFGLSCCIFAMFACSVYEACSFQMEEGYRVDQSKREDVGKPEIVEVWATTAGMYCIREEPIFNDKNFLIQQ